MMQKLNKKRHEKIIKNFLGHPREDEFLRGCLKIQNEFFKTSFCKQKEVNKNE